MVYGELRAFLGVDLYNIGVNSLASLVEHPQIQQAVAAFTTASQAVHRRPVNLRKFEVTHSESVLRGARASGWLSPAMGETTAIDTYSILAPALVDAQTRTLTRAPLQVLARLDTLAGGPGRPVQAAPELQQLAGLLQAPLLAQYPVVLPVCVHNYLCAGQYFGPRTSTISRVLLRLALMASGADPRGLGVPEVHFWRHQQDYEAVVQAPAAVASVEYMVTALTHGMQEAEGIAAAV